MTERRWQDGLMIVLGLWLIISPFTLQYPDYMGIAALSSYVFGVAVILFAALALARPQMWEEWVNLALGILLILSPFALRFDDIVVARWNHVVLGLLICADALWARLQYPIHKTTTK